MRVLFLQMSRGDTVEGFYTEYSLPAQHAVLCYIAIWATTTQRKSTCCNAGCSYTYQNIILWWHHDEFNVIVRTITHEFHVIPRTMLQSQRHSTVEGLIHRMNESVRAMPVGCYKQMSAIKEGVIMRLQCISNGYIYGTIWEKILCLAAICATGWFSRMVVLRIKHVPSLHAGRLYFVYSQHLWLFLIKNIIILLLFYRLIRSWMLIFRRLRIIARQFCRLFTVVRQISLRHGAGGRSVRHGARRGGRVALRPVVIIFNLARHSWNKNK